MSIFGGTLLSVKAKAFNFILVQRIGCLNRIQIKSRLHSMRYEKQRHLFELIYFSVTRITHFVLALHNLHVYRLDNR